MKRFLIIVTILIILYIGWDTAYYRMGFYIDTDPEVPITTEVKIEGEKIYKLIGDTWEEFTIKGVDMGSGIPGKWSTEFAIPKERYSEWFAQIQEMGANTLRVYTVQNDDFYEAFYEYNEGRELPLYLIQGVWVNDYIQNSYRDAYDDNFIDTLLTDCKSMVDVIHGKKKLVPGAMESAGSGTYRHDISRWVIGYILGVEWEDVTVRFTDEKYENDPKRNSYAGEYLYTTEDASPFEAMLAGLGDRLVEYESKRYKTQRLLAFTNWPTTDPFEYPEDVGLYFRKCAEIDVEHIKTTENMISGQFASYHVYPYYPDYLEYIDDWTIFGLDSREDYIVGDYGEGKEYGDDREDSEGEEDGEAVEYIKGVTKVNTYLAYLTMLTNHHTMPVIISEFGVSTGRGMAQREQNLGRNQGAMSEKEQGRALISCWEDIMNAGCAGGCVFTWQDEWFKRTWNTMYAVDMGRTAYWSDYQTNEQYFGLLSFDPGKEKSICYVDGNISEWNETDKVVSGEDMTLSMKYDEKFIYFLIYKENLDFANDYIFVPIDVTDYSGATYSGNYGIAFDRPVDFLIAIHGKKDSRILVQERYEALRANYSGDVYGIDTYAKSNVPEKDSSRFVKINMVLQTATTLIMDNDNAPVDMFETGVLKYGNANPENPVFDSLADFICNGDYIELKLPWQLLNFADPSQMIIHADYYDGNYGIDYQKIDKMHVGIGTSHNTSEAIGLVPYALTPWKNKPTSHERLKASYYIMQEYWTKN